MRTIRIKIVRAVVTALCIIALMKGLFYVLSTWGIHFTDFERTLMAILVLMAIAWADTCLEAKHDMDRRKRGLPKLHNEPLYHHARQVMQRLATPNADERDFRRYVNARVVFDAICSIEPSAEVDLDKLAEDVRLVLTTYEKE